MSDAVVREWTRLLGSPVFDITSSVSVAADGSIYVAGSSMVEPGNLAGSNSSYLTKFNSDGSGGSENLLGSDFNGVPYSVKTAADGSIYIAGIGISYLEGQPNGDIFVIKYNADGSPQWMDALGSDNDEYMDSSESVALGTDGSIYIAGYTYGDLDGHANRGSSDAFIAKYRSDGSKEWTQFIGSSSEERATGVSAAADGSVYLVGSTRESLDGQTNRGEDDIFISKYSSDGSKEWTRLLGSMTSDLAWSVSTSADGSIYIAGFTYGDLDGQVNAGGSDVFVAKYSSDGAKEWVKQFGSSADDYANSVTTASDGSIYIAGVTLGNLDGQINSGEGDAFIAKYSSDGSEVWTQLLGSSSDDFGLSVTTGADGSIYMAGGSAGDLDGQTNSGDYDGFIAKYRISDPTDDVLIEDSGVYKFLQYGQQITLKSSRGRTYSDASSRFWDAVKAVGTGTGFDVLLEGVGPRSGRFLVWSTNAAGVITDRLGWTSGDQMQARGYEQVFGRDFNGDGFTGQPPAVDADGDGLIDGASTYQLLKDGQAINLTNRGKTISDASSRFWDVKSAARIGSDFKLLLEGEGQRAGKFLVWSANEAGVITDRSRWITPEQMLELGYEDLFARDFNGDGSTGQPPAVDADGDGLIDGASTYKLLKDGQAVSLLNRGQMFSDGSSPFWNVEKAVATDTGFQVLLEGEGSRAGQFLVWGANDAGVIKGQSRWISPDRMFDLGYEDLFGRDFNGDGITGEMPPTGPDFKSDLVIRGNSLYTIVDASSWSDAEAQAVRLGGHLATINNDSENTFVEQLVYENGTTTEEGGVAGWIGLTDIDSDGAYEWVSGEISSYRNWDVANYQPNGSPQNNSGIISGSESNRYADPFGREAGKWHDYNPGEVAEPNIGIAETPFIRRGNSAYVIVEGPTWEEAEANAVALGGHLVTINDSQEWEWFKNEFTAAKYGYPESFGEQPNGWNYPNGEVQLWVGLNDIASEVTINGPLVKRVLSRCLS